VSDAESFASLTLSRGFFVAICVLISAARTANVSKSAI